MTLRSGVRGHNLSDVRPLEITRAGLVGTLAVFVVAAVCVRLGFWQLDRRDQRLERNAAAAVRMAEPMLSLTVAPSDTTGLPYRRAAVEGEYDNDRVIVLAGRSRAGVPGVHLFTPLRMDGGSLLVNRGWLPSRDAATIDPGAVVRRGRVRVEGLFLPFPEVENPATGGGFRTTWFRLDGQAIRDQFPYPVAPVYLLRQRPGEAGGTAGRGEASGDPVTLDPPDLSAGPHLSYAVQWFSFALIFVVGWAALVVRRSQADAGGPAAEGL